MHSEEASYQRELRDILVQNQVVMDVLQKARAFALPGWYLGSGAVIQTVWNHRHGFDLTHGINDYDIVYFDGTDISFEAEDKCINLVSEYLVTCR